MDKLKQYFTDKFKDDLLGIPFFIGAAIAILLPSPIIWIVCFICLLFLSFVCSLIFGFEASIYISFIAWSSTIICGLLYLCAFAFLAYIFFSSKI